MPILAGVEAMMCPQDVLIHVFQIPPRLRAIHVSLSAKRKVEDDNVSVRSIAFGCSSSFFRQKEE